VSPFRPLIGLLAVSAFAADAPLDKTLKAVEARYNAATSLEVLFHEDYTPPGRPHRSESGKLLLSRPGRMRWEYSQPQGKLWISDGKTVWMYTPADRRVEKSPFKTSDDLRAPLAFLLGKLHFDKEFRNLVGKPEGSAIRVQAEPRSDSLPYSRVEFVVTAENRIQEVIVTGVDRSVLAYRFEQEKLNPALNGNLFKFQIPAEAELVETDK
jgi:outer membrane lipoprotein carrier protein